MGRVVSASLAAFLGVSALMLGTSALNILRAASRRQELSAGQLFFADGWEVGLYLAFLGLLLVTGILWMVWQHRAHANLNALQRAYYRPGAIWWWIVPVATLFMPFLAIRELAQASSDRPTLRRWWWGTYIGWNTASAV